MGSLALAPPRRLKDHKNDLLSLLVGWPAESRDCEKRFGIPEGRLFPLLGRRVATPQGEGVLLQVLNRTAAVRLDRDAEKAQLFNWREVQPPESSSGQE